MLNILDSIFQKIEQAKMQQDINSKKLPLDDGHSLSEEERGEAEYDIYYASIKEKQPEQFELIGDCIDIFSWDRDKRLFQIFQNNNQFYGVYKQESKEAHKVTQVFQSKEEVLLNAFGTSEFERFRGHVLYILKDGKVFTPQNNQEFRLNLVKPFKANSFYENIEQARTFIVKDELQKDPKIGMQAIRRTLEDYYIPSDFLGKTITLKSMTKDKEGIRISFEENEKEQTIRIPDLNEKWLKRIRVNPRMKVVFDELIMESSTIGQSFLSFFNFEIKKELQTRHHDFEVISNKEGAYIGKFYSTGELKKISPYFSEKEAIDQLEKLNHYIKLEKQKDRYKAKEIKLSNEFMEISEKD
ncbi:hypothetical protein [Neobacillus cucumis]|uniref:hypothetical protein n=1 Tax=Neobacillus cucumis TaxID=1740721 RepID=UPI002852F838|nr:hypothetical protein [Neobacillus cucumis]MDR4950460.1 hypothetical protein [Neobacillus cucumis]